MAKVPDYRDEKGCTAPDYHHPALMDRDDWETQEKKILDAVRSGMRPHQAFKYAGFSEFTYYLWKRNFEEDIKRNVFDSPLVKFMFKLSSQSQILHKELLDKAREIALDDKGSPEMIKFMLGKIYKYDSKQEIDIKTDDETTFNIQIVDYKPKEEKD